MYDTSLFVFGFMDKNVNSFTPCTFNSQLAEHSVPSRFPDMKTLWHTYYMCTTVYLSTKEVHKAESEGEGVGYFGWKGGWSSGKEGKLKRFVL